MSNEDREMEAAFLKMMTTGMTREAEAAALKLAGVADRWLQERIGRPASPTAASSHYHMAIAFIAAWNRRTLSPTGRGGE